jgi:general secretion pathway protein D
MLAPVMLTGCPKGSQDTNAGTKAEALHDYDTALDYYNKALQTSPSNTEFQLKADRARFEASQWHVDQGRRMREQGSLELAMAEFRKAQMIDPSSPVAQQEVKATMDLINAKQGTTQNGESTGAPSGEPKLMTGPPQVQPLSRAPINMKATNDSKAVFEAIGKLAGLTVIFDPDFTSRRISVELTNVTLEQALNISALQSKAFWRPVTSNIIFVVPDQPQKRKDYEEEVVKTFYLHNTVLPQELTEIVTSIRQLLDLRRVQQINAQNAIVIRDTPDRVLLAGKIIDDIDKAKPEVVIQVAVMEARRDRLRNVGITPPASVTASFVNPVTTTTTSGTTTSTNNSATFSQLLAAPFSNLLPQGYSITLPSATANFLMTDSSTQILDDPEIRVVDGQTAKLRIGDRIPVATGSFQAGIGVGATTGAVNPLVNTQFQYLDVGVNVDVTPRIHPDHEISMKINVVVSSQTGSTNIGGINQPIISQRSIEHDIRLKDGEVNVLGGLMEETDTNSMTGLPGLSRVPGLRYLFGSNVVDHEKDEILIVLIPHIVRMPSISVENLRSISSGTDTNAEVRLEDAVLLPDALKPQAAPAAQAQPAPAAAAPAATPANASMSQNASLQFEPGTAALKVGETSTIGVTVQNVQDLYSIPMLLQFNPAVISIEDVRQGGFLSGGTQEVAIVERVDKERGQAIISATRMPNTPGVSGSGTLVGIVVKAIAPGNSQLSIVQVNAKDSQQRPIQVVTGEATVRVQ